MSVKAISFDLDSIAAMGKFPRFCVNTYRWGDKFFNGYDTTYVAGTGYKWNAKLRTESWTDYYELHFDNSTEMSMISDPSTSVGLYLSYMALSVGYDMNVSKYFDGHEDARRRWNFGFNCMLFSANLYFIKNDVGSHIDSFSPSAKTATTPISNTRASITRAGVLTCHIFLPTNAIPTPPHSISHASRNAPAAHSWPDSPSTE